MDPEELLKTIRKQPFEPIRLHVSDGKHYDIRHPDQIIVAQRVCHVGITNNGGGLALDIARVANIHITRIEPLRRPRHRRADRPGRKSR